MIHAASSMIWRLPRMKVPAEPPRGRDDQELPIEASVQGVQSERVCSGANIMKRVLMASVIAGTFAIVTIATPTSAHAQWGRGWGWGLGGLALGLTIGAALSRPAYAYGYGYPAYSYGYGPAYGYANSGYGYGPAGYGSYGYGYPAYSYASYGYPGYGYGGGYYRPAYRSAYRLSTSLPSRRLRRLSGRPPRCDPPRSLAMSRLSTTARDHGQAEAHGQRGEDTNLQGALAPSR